MDNMSKPAIVEYGPGQFKIVSQGSYVLCAVTGQRIALERLKYWSVEHQEAYATLDAVHQRHDKPLNSGD
ncbi:MAG TPA: DUF2093 domain-containing protein [Sneathiellales bacterium]|jgi:hypothetical protein|nr:DUF2093 domain-containing protein [Sneathiellales bacterium]